MMRTNLSVCHRDYCTSLLQFHTCRVAKVSIAPASVLSVLFDCGQGCRNICTHESEYMQETIY